MTKILLVPMKYSVLSSGVFRPLSNWFEENNNLYAQASVQEQKDGCGLLATVYDENGKDEYGFDDVGKSHKEVYGDLCDWLGSVNLKNGNRMLKYHPLCEQDHFQFEA